MYNEVKQFNANIFYNSSWALFAMEPSANTDKEDPDYTLEEEASSKKEEQKNKLGGESQKFTPFCFYGSNFSFDKSEHKIIKGMRTWAKANFAKHVMLPAKWTTQLKDIPKVGGQQPDSGKFYDFDLRCKVIQKLRIDESSTELRLIDDSN